MYSGSKEHLGKAQPMNVTRVQSGDVSLHVSIEGSGPAVILAQFFRSSSVAHFEPVIGGLARSGFTVVAVDPRGLGNSAGSLDRLTHHDLARDIATVIETLGSGPAHVVGTAYAGFVARCLAADRPDRVCSVTITAVGGLSGIISSNPRYPEILPVYASIFSPVQSPEERRQAIQTAVYAPSSHAQATVHDYEVGPQAAAALMAAHEATPVEDYWTAGIAPMLVLQGLEDRIALPEDARALREQLGERVEIVEIPHAGHILIPEQPDLVLNAMVAFLRKH